MVIKNLNNAPIKLKYLIQLDRRGANDCVFYDCDNSVFKNYIESFGFITNFGSFSDISFICPAWKTAGVNLSVGYYNEHSNSEYLCVGQLFDTIEKVKLMLKDVESIEYFKYIKMPEEKHWFQSMEFFSNIFTEEQDKKKCCLCGEQDYEYNLVPVKVKDGKILNYCITCLNMDENIFWCLECGEPFINENLSDSYCEDCRGKN